MLPSVEIAASWVALGLTGRAMGEFWRSLYCAIHPTPRGRPLRGAGCNSRPLLFPDLPFTPRRRYQPARWRWGSVGGPRAGFAVIFSTNSTPHRAGARCAAPDALRSKWRHLTSRSPLVEYGLLFISELGNGGRSSACPRGKRPNRLPCWQAGQGGPPGGHHTPTALLKAKIRSGRATSTAPSWSSGWCWVFGVWEVGVRAAC